MHSILNLLTTEDILEIDKMHVFFAEQLCAVNHPVGTCICIQKIIMDGLCTKAEDLLTLVNNSDIDQDWRQRFDEFH